MTKAPTSGTQCPACGGSGECHDPSEVQQRILELEAHVRELNERAALTGKCARCLLWGASPMRESSYGDSMQSTTLLAMVTWGLLR